MWFYIEGNIGSGKSTLCRLLNEILEDVEVIYEPVEKWRSMKDDESGINILEAFYKDQSRWSYSLQTYTFLTRIYEILKPQDKKYRFVERSIYTDKFIFAKSLLDTGKMTSLEWNMYCDWFTWLSDESYKKIDKPSGFIYIRADPEISFQRMMKRERSEEKCVPIEYLKTISKYHDDWLMSDEYRDNVLVIDVNNDFENDEKFMSEIKNKILNFVASR
jgi:deoxyadenosine/deoxycytidine kinase